MRAFVVFESMYGNTAAVAERIAAALREEGIEAETRPATEASAHAADDMDLLVVGGPTHAHGMSWSLTRKVAAGDTEFEEATLSPGLRHWFHHLPRREGRPAAAFDTRFERPSSGSAAKGIARRLQRHGYLLALEPESFFVTTEGELVEGQLERAEAWGRGIAESIRPGAVA